MALLVMPPTVRRNEATAVAGSLQLPMRQLQLRLSAMSNGCHACTPYVKTVQRHPVFSVHSYEPSCSASSLVPNNAQEVIPDGANTELHRGTNNLYQLWMSGLTKRISMCTRIPAHGSHIRAQQYGVKACGLTISVGSTRMPTMRSRTSEPAMTRTCHHDKQLRVSCVLNHQIKLAQDWTLSLGCRRVVCVRYVPSTP